MIHVLTHLVYLEVCSKEALHSHCWDLECRLDRHAGQRDGEFCSQETQAVWVIDEFVIHHVMMEHYLHAPWDLVLVELVVCCRGQWCSILGSRGRRDLHRKYPAQHHKPRGHSNLPQLPLSNIHPRRLNKETALEMFRPMAPLIYLFVY